MKPDFNFAECFSPESRVWLYQSSRAFTDAETAEMDTLLTTFSKQWTAHNQQLIATGKVLFGRFIVLLVDETHTDASGCSIDKSVHFIQEIERKYEVNLFDRLTLAFQQDNAIITIPVAQVREKFLEGVINEQSLLFNNTVQTLSDLENNWMVAAGNSWLASRLKKEVVKG